MPPKPGKVLCVGDSLTFGSIGYSYIPYLRPELKAVNAGINGDTTLGAYRRLQKYTAKPRYAGISTYVISIGTNDLLLPYLPALSPLWKLQMEPRIAWKKCITDDAAFAAAYEDILRLLKSRGKAAVLVGLPFIQLKDFPLEKLRGRNAAIQRLAAKYEMHFVDTYLLQESALRKPSRPYSWGFSSLVRVLDGAAMLALPFSKDLFSRTRRLELTVDGVHFNSLSAKLVAAEVNKYLYPDGE